MNGQLPERHSEEMKEILQEKGNRRLQEFIAEEVALGQPFLAAKRWLIGLLRTGKMIMGKNWKIPLELKVHYNLRTEYVLFKDNTLYEIAEGGRHSKKIGRELVVLARPLPIPTRFMTTSHKEYLLP